MEFFSKINNFLANINFLILSALFAILYFTLIMTYLILKKLYQNTFENSQLILKEKISTQCWKCAAISIAWLIITIFHMIIFCALYVNLFSGTSKPIFAIALFLGGKFSSEKKLTFNKINLNI